MFDQGRISVIDGPHASERPARAEPSAYRPVQYLGNKLRVLDEIGDAAIELCPNGGRAVDLFTGTSVVAQRLASCGFSVSAVDTQNYAVTFASSLLGANREADEAVLFEVDDEIPLAMRRGFEFWDRLAEVEEQHLASGDYQALRQFYSDLPLRWKENATGRPDDGFLITPNYAGSYFGIRQALRLDVLSSKARNELASGNLTPWAFDSVLTAIMSAASTAVHSAGKHFAQPLIAGNSTNTHFLSRRMQDDRSVDILGRFREALDAVCRNAAFGGGLHEALAGEAEEVAEREKYKGGLYYLDPPYTAQQYSRFYHVLETLVTNREPQLSSAPLTTGLYPAARYKSAFSSKRKALAACQRILQAAKKNEASVLISYSESAANSDGNARMISRLELTEACTAVFGSKSVQQSRMHHRYRQFNSAAHSNDKRDDPEVLILCKS